MVVPRHLSQALAQFVDDEMLRAPLLFDQLIDGTIEHAGKGAAGMSPLQRSTVADLVLALQRQRTRLAEYFMHSLREQVAAELPGQAVRAVPKPAQRQAQAQAQALALVDDDVVALDVELSHAIEAINSTAEYELRELQTFISALVGDMDVSTDHNPFRAETFARAVWASAQALPLSRGHQVAFMRSAGTPLAQLLRKTYAASSSRLEAMGVEPAAYRTLILPSGSRRGRRAGETTFSPDLHRMRDSMPAPLDGAKLTFDGQAHRLAAAAAAAAPRTPKNEKSEKREKSEQADAGSGRDQPIQPGHHGQREHWSEVARGAASRLDRQAIELVSRLFDAMAADERVPEDVSLVISRLHGPAMQLTLRDGSMLDQDKHPLWRFVNRLVFEAEMAPDAGDPERNQLLRTAQATVDQLAAEPEQNAGLYRWALDRLEVFLQKRLTRRLAAAASQIGALQKLEDKLDAGHAAPSTMNGTLDAGQLDTVPAALLDAKAAAAQDSAEAWLDSLRPGDWLRVFLQSRWVHARLLWPGERREVWLLGDGASDATWAVRRGALLSLYNARLAKSLRQRSIVASAAGRVQEQMAAAAA